jgi:hypothetical protein
MLLLEGAKRSILQWLRAFTFKNNSPGRAMPNSTRSMLWIICRFLASCCILIERSAPLNSTFIRPNFQKQHFGRLRPGRNLADNTAMGARVRGLSRDRDTWCSTYGFFIKQLPLGPWYTGWSPFEYGFEFAKKIADFNHSGINDTAETKNNP